ncbi:hypothetical protein [Variibacter gotjawalensis]|uniref:hypothetical protein n=1 Tax=Variibacter gotjawalensis TaxID=1333996 RepID=UPI0012FDFDB7|nr:hypothetical protein [Variibacter gotjawalensis]NIK47305.1 hypothetical protein [Variibacter gotjawalensis]
MITNGLALRGDPGLEHGVGALDPPENTFDAIGSFEQTRMRRAGIGRSNHFGDVDADILAIERDAELVGQKAAEPGGLKSAADFMQRLPQRGTRTLFGRVAPQQADQLLAIFLPRIGKGEVTQQRLRLAILKHNVFVADAQREVAKQRHRQDGVLRPVRSGSSGHRICGTVATGSIAVRLHSRSQCGEVKSEPKLVTASNSWQLMVDVSQTKHLNESIRERNSSVPLFATFVNADAPHLPHREF